MVMARPPRGREFVEKALDEIEKTKDANELRILQTVVLPFQAQMTTEQIAKIVGRSPRWVTASRNEYIEQSGNIAIQPVSIRNHAHMSIEEEAQFLTPFLDLARKGGVLVVNEIHQALEQHLGHKVARATTYNMLHRHNWRKISPDKRNVEADVKKQEEWKKNSLKLSVKSRKKLERKPPSD
jgi:transposase